jgi:outer membrane murein-binding lipoprotein Lpp
MGHRLGKHHLKPVYQDQEEGPPKGQTRPSSQSDNPFQDLEQDVPAMKSAINAAKWRARLKTMDPSAYRVLFPGEATGEAPGSVSSKLVDLEMANYVRSLTEKNESSRQPQIVEGPYEEVTEYVDKNGNLTAPDRAFTMRTTKRPVALATGESSDVRELKEEVRALNQKLEDQRFESLKSTMESSISSLRNELNSNQSELKTMIVEAADLAKTWIASPGPAAQIAAAKLGFKAVVVEDFPPAAPEGARNGVVEGLKPHGFVARIVEKESASS